MFRQIESNKRWSALLMLASFALLAGFGWALDTYFDFPGHFGLFIATGLALILGVVGYFDGDDLILSASYARRITHADNPQLFNVVEEVAIACGQPAPAVYLIDEPSPNAFATGRNPKDAKIAVTQGLLDKLNRDELQGVIAHEMAHVRNYDILFMTLMAVMVGTIALLSDGLWRSRYCFRGGGRGKGSGLLLLLALLLLIFAPIAAKLIQMAASRKREYLADASAAVITRYPAGLASALRKISADPAPLACANRATQHMYIVNPLKGEGGASLWDTHPPLEERIGRLEKMAYLPQTPGAALAPAAAVLPLPLVAAALASQGGAPTPQALSAAEGQQTGTPPPASQGGASGEGGVPTQTAGTPPTDTNACPRCREKLRRGKIDAHQIRGCTACGGLWIADADLAALLRVSPTKLVQADNRYPNRIGSGWHSFADKHCPECDAPLRAEPLAGHERLIVDRCASGHGVWFDDGEMAALAAGPAGARG